MYVLRINIKVGGKNLYQKGLKDNLELFSALKIETGKNSSCEYFSCIKKLGQIYDLGPDHLKVNLQK